MKTNDTGNFIGIDGGGTKTSICLIGRDAKVIAESRADEPGNISAMGGARAAENFYKIIKNNTGGVEISGITAAVAGYSNRAELEKFTGAFKGYFPDNENIFIMPDYGIFFKCSWDWDDFGEKEYDCPRILVIAGTGSVIIGRGKNAESGEYETLKMFGGGAMISDPGSGFDLGLRFIRRLTTEYELGKVSGEMYDVLAAHGITNIGALMEELKISCNLSNPAHGASKKIAAFAPALVDMAEKFDDSKYFAETFDAASNIADGIRRMLKKFGYSAGNGQFHLLLNGGLIRNSEYYKKMILALLKASLGAASMKIYMAPENVSTLCAAHALKNSR